MKQFIYSLVAMLLVFTGSLQAQTTKAIPEDPTVPHFVKLEVNDPAGGTFTGTAEVAGIGTIDIAQGVSTDLPNATIAKVIAKPNEGWKIDRITEQFPGQEESDLDEIDIEAGYEGSFELTENLTLKAYFIQIGSYSVKYNLTNLTVDKYVTSIEEGNSLLLTLSPTEEGFLLPDHIRVTMGDPNNVLEGVYNAENGMITIPNVTGNIEITAEAIDNRYYTVTVDAKHLTYDKDAIKPVKAGYPLNTIIFTPEKGYKLPTTAKVTMGGRELTAIEYAYDSTTGALEVPNVRGDIVITIEAVPATSTYYKITYNLSDHLWVEMLNPAVNVPSEVEANKSFLVVLYAEVGYKVPETISVTMGGVEISDAYLWVENENRGEIHVNTVTGDVVITANEVVDGTALDTDGLEGIQITEVPPIILWDPLPLTLRADAGYHLPETITVKMSGKTLVEGEDYEYNYTTSTAVASLYIYEVTGPIEIIAEALKDEEPDDPDPTPDPDPDPEDPDDPDPTPTPDPDPEDPDDPDVPTATADISGDVVKVWAANGVLHIHTPQPATVRVVSFSGALFRLMDVPGGDVQFTLPDNLYIVTVGNEVKKIKVR